MTVSPKILAARPTPEQVEAAKARFLWGDGFSVWLMDASGVANNGEWVTDLSFDHFAAAGTQRLHFRLKGNHMEQYRALVEQGCDACLVYYWEHLAESHPSSSELIIRHFECLWSRLPEHRVV